MRKGHCASGPSCAPTRSDIGGATHGGYNPGATEIWQEGLRIPPIRLGEAGGLREDLLRMLATNTRIPRDFRGDLMAMVGAARLGRAAAAAAAGEIRRGDALDAAVSAILDLSEAHARRILATWPDGILAGEAFLDDDGFDRTDIAIRARVTKRGESLTVDLSESDPQTTGLRQFQLPQHAQRRRDGLRLPARPRNSPRTTAPSARSRSSPARAPWSGRGRARR